MTLGEILRNLLAEKDITQKQLANSLNIGSSTLGNYIQDTREPDYKMLKCLADYFNVTTDYLLDHQTEPIKGHQEAELLRVFRTLNKEQQELFIAQGKLFIALNNKKTKSSPLMTIDNKTG